ncbi:MAG: hypothetical protein AAF655_25905 [Bacteroidota bacterium]
MIYNPAQITLLEEGISFAKHDMIPWSMIKSIRAKTKSSGGLHFLLLELTLKKNKEVVAFNIAYLEKSASQIEELTTSYWRAYREGT